MIAFMEHKIIRDMKVESRKPTLRINKTD